MSDRLPSKDPPNAERRARDECDALLERLQAAGRDDARLSQVRHAIASGEFQVDARVIAERLISRFLAS